MDAEQLRQLVAMGAASVIGGMVASIIRRGGKFDKKTITTIVIVSIAVISLAVIIILSIE